MFMFLRNSSSLIEQISISSIIILPDKGSIKQVRILLMLIYLLLFYLQFQLLVFKEVFNLFLRINFEL